MKLAVVLKMFADAEEFLCDVQSSTNRTHSQRPQFVVKG